MNGSVKFGSAHVSPTYSVIVVRFCFCILHPEILVLSATPEPFYFIVIIRICIRLKSEKRTSKKCIFSLKNMNVKILYKMLTKSNTLRK